MKGFFMKKEGDTHIGIILNELDWKFVIDIVLGSIIFFAIAFSDGIFSLLQVRHQPGVGPLQIFGMFFSAIYISWTILYMRYHGRQKGI